MANSKKKVLFLTTANLSMKPRLVKEITLAKNMNYDVDLIAFKINNWTDDNHDLLARKLKINNNTIFATKKNFIIWLIASLVHIVAKKIWFLFKKNNFLSAFASNKRTVMLWLYIIFKIKKKDYFLVIGRNTATIFPLLYLNKYHNLKIAFDVEDYHPGEKVTWDNANKEKLRRIHLMRQLFKTCSYISFAGTPIMNHVKKNIEIHPNVPLLNLPNSFYSNEFEQPNNQNTKEKKIKLIWFSVDISANRGLEELITVLKDLSNDFHLTVYGTKIESFHKQWIKPNAHFITVKDPVSQSILHKELKNYDIGLALEMSKTDINKQLAISNKLYAYMQAGLYILATNTLGHETVLKNSQSMGVVCGQAPENIKEALLTIKDNISNIKKESSRRFRTGLEYSWENNCEILKKQWTLITNTNSYPKTRLN